MILWRLNKHYKAGLFYFLGVENLSLMAIKTNYIVAPWLLYMLVIMGPLIFMLGWWVGDKNQLKHLDPVKSKLLSMPDLKLWQIQCQCRLYMSTGLKYIAARACKLQVAKGMIPGPPPPHPPSSSMVIELIRAVGYFPGNICQPVK